MEQGGTSEGTHGAFLEDKTEYIGARSVHPEQVRNKDMRNIKTYIGLGLSSAVLASTASAEMTGRAFEVGYAWSGATFGGTTQGYVVDLYLEFTSGQDILLNVYNYNDINIGASYYQGLTASGWSPNLQAGPFETQDALEFDSFIAIGGVTEYSPDDRPYQMAGNGVATDPNFGGNGAAGPAANAGWYNGNPNNPLGRPGTGPIPEVVFMGRFSIENSDGFSLIGSTGFATFNEGIGTPGQQAEFEVVPTPGALALLGLAGLAGRRRRK